MLVRLVNLQVHRVNGDGHGDKRLPGLRIGVRENRTRETEFQMNLPCPKCGNRTVIVTGKRLRCSDTSCGYVMEDCEPYPWADTAFGIVFIGCLAALLWYVLIGGCSLLRVTPASTTPPQPTPNNPPSGELWDWAYWLITAFAGFTAAWFKQRARDKAKKAAKIEACAENLIDVIEDEKATPVKKRIAELGDEWINRKVAERFPKA